MQIRFKLHRLVHKEGMRLEEALKRVLPDDRNRNVKLATWKKYKCWPLQDDELEIYAQQAGQNLTGEMSEVSDESCPAETSEESESTRPERKSAGTFTQNQIEQIHEIVRKEIQSVMESQRIQRRPSDLLEVPPSPGEKIKGEKGRPANPGKRVKLAGTVDVELERLFREECTKRGISVSRLLDTVLWHYFGKPRLSFETSDKSD